MQTVSDEDQKAFRDAVYTAAGRADVRPAIGRIYDQLAEEIVRHKPVCQSSGRCCKFEEYGHRMFITTLELAAFVYELETQSWPQSLEDSRKNWNGKGCPFQVAGMCGVHTIRPFGCRIFFCESTPADFSILYEHFHAELKRLHQVMKVPYFYVEWRAALKAMGLAEGGLYVPVAQ